MIVADNGSNWYFSGSSDRRWDDENLDQLKRIPGSAFQVVRSAGPPPRLLSAQPVAEHDVVELGPQPGPQFLDRRLGRLAPPSSPLTSTTSVAGIALQLVLDRLDDVLVADPRLGLDPGLGERRDGRDQVALGLLARALDVGGPAVEEADPRRGQHQHLGIGPRLEPGRGG